MLLLTPLSVDYNTDVVKRFIVFYLLSKKAVWC